MASLKSGKKNLRSVRRRPQRPILPSVSADVRSQNDGISTEGQSDEREPINVPCGESVWLGRSKQCLLKDVRCSREEINVAVAATSSPSSTQSSLTSSTVDITAGKHSIQVANCNRLLDGTAAAAVAVAAAPWEDKAPHGKCRRLGAYTLIAVVGADGAGSGRKATYQLVPAERLVVDWIKQDQARWWPYTTPQDRPLSHLWVKNANTVDENSKILASGGT